MKKGAFWASIRSSRNQRRERPVRETNRERKRHHAEWQRYWNRLRKRWLREQTEKDVPRG